MPGPATAVVALGTGPLVTGLRLAGVRVVEAADPEAVRAAWHGTAGAGVVLLTRAAADALGEDRWARGAPLTAVLP